MNSNKDFVETYNAISSIIEELIDNNDMSEMTNRRYIAGYLLQELAKRGLLKDSVNKLDIESLYWRLTSLVGRKMKSFDGKIIEWIKDKDI